MKYWKATTLRLTAALLMAVLMLTGCGKTVNDAPAGDSTDNPPVSITADPTGQDKKEPAVDAMTEGMKVTRYIDQSGRKYADTEWLVSQPFWDTEYDNDFTPYVGKGLLVPSGNTYEDVICIGNLIDKSASYILFEGNIPMEAYMDRLVKGNIESVHKETVEDGYVICIHTKDNGGEGHDYLFRYMVEGKDVYFLSISDTTKHLFFQLGMSDALDLENLDLTDEIVDQELELCSCGCDDVLGTCTEDEECNDAETGCIEDGYVLID